MLERIPNRRVGMISGWAVDPNAVYRYQVDAAFPLSDHADYDDLIRYVEMVQPRRVLTLHGFAAAFADDLRARGIEAWALSEENQMELHLLAAGNAPPVRPSAGVSRTAELTQGSVRQNACDIQSKFLVFANVGEAIAATSSKLDKIRLLADYLRNLTSDELPVATLYFTGRVFAQSDLRTLQVGWTLIFRALQAATGIGDAKLRRIASVHGDAGKSAFEVLNGRTVAQPFNIRESRELFEDLRRARGPGAKAKLLENRFSILSPREGKYVVKILTGDLRLGLREGLVEEAIAKAFDVPFEQVREANMLLGDIGQTAALAARKELHRAELSIFRPIKCMLATPQPSAEAVWERFVGAAEADRGPALPTRATVYLEDKFDGIRAQLHRSTQRVEIFSRDLRRITGQFRELADQAGNLQEELIIDGEIIAFQEGRRLTFFDLQRRLGRESGGEDLFARAAADVPVAFVVFDLLWLNGQSLLTTPLRERRKHLNRVRLPSQFQIASVISAHSAAEIEQSFQQARRRLNEGLMIKDPESFYLPGTRGMFWFKLKKELATLDVVVVAAELGHGKRNNVLSDYTFAVRDDVTGELFPIGNAYSGLTDAEIAELTAHFKQNTIV